MSLERVLAKLQRTVRLGQQPESDSPATYSRQVPTDLDKDMTLTLTKSERELMVRTLATLEVDPRFEHLRPRAAVDAVWRFICLSWLDRKTDHTRWFMSSHERRPFDTVCYFPLEHLVVQRRLSLGDLTLLPIDDPEIPQSRDLDLSSAGGGFLAVPTKGTSLPRMKDRARILANHALRLLRVGLRADQGITDEQLRFRIGEVYVFREGGMGWALAEDAAIEATLSADLEEILTNQPLVSLRSGEESKGRRQALTALQWLDRARLATEEVVRTLYNFFAMEALLGDPSEGEKGLSLTFRRTILALAVSGHFSDPLRLFFMYDQIRSTAVHGETPPDIDSKQHRRFDWNAREALNEYLIFARDRALRKRSEVIRALESHERADQLLKWLRDRDPRWESFSLQKRKNKG